jgi:hypothetical protein
VKWLSNEHSNVVIVSTGGNYPLGRGAQLNARNAKVRIFIVLSKSEVREQDVEAVDIRPKLLANPRRSNRPP